MAWSLGVVLWDSKITGNNSHQTLEWSSTGIVSGIELYPGPAS